MHHHLYLHCCILNKITRTFLGARQGLNRNDIHYSQTEIEDEGIYQIQKKIRLYPLIYTFVVILNIASA